MGLWISTVQVRPIPQDMWTVLRTNMHLEKLFSAEIKRVDSYFPCLLCPPDLQYPRVEIWWIINYIPTVLIKMVLWQVKTLYTTWICVVSKKIDVLQQNFLSLLWACFIWWKKELESSQLVERLVVSVKDTESFECHAKEVKSLSWMWL